MKPEAQFRKRFTRSHSVSRARRRMAVVPVVAVVRGADPTSVVVVVVRIAIALSLLYIPPCCADRALGAQRVQRNVRDG
jgi:hypothetical protein